jgi:hypothetical protein
MRAKFFGEEASTSWNVGLLKKEFPITSMSLWTSETKRGWMSCSESTSLI